jgi:hypothetical protein
MATVTNKRKVLSIAEKVNVIPEIGNGKENSDMCQEFGLVNSTIQRLEKKNQNY